MRLWHKDLIGVLPDKQLLGQWRELCAIVGDIKKNGAIKHPLVKKLQEYNKSHFYNYCCMVVNEMFFRGMSINDQARGEILDYVSPEERQIGASITYEQLFEYWHNKRYLIQCYYNLQEKYDCGMVSDEEWGKIVEVVCNEIYKS